MTHYGRTIAAIAVVAAGFAHQSMSLAQTASAPKTEHQLAPLPYAYNALEPYYDAETVRIHHDLHHAAYVRGLNSAEEKLIEARKTGDLSAIQLWERLLAFNGSGDILHTIFFANMTPNGGGEPTGELMEQIRRDFGSYEAFRKQFTQAAVTVEASGWAVLGWSPEYRRLYIVQVLNHQNNTLMGLRPLLVLDMWEHAYYLKFQNRRPEWVESWWNIVNWPDVARRFAEARKNS